MGGCGLAANQEARLGTELERRAAGDRGLASEGHFGSSRSLGFLARDMPMVIPASQGLLYTRSDNVFEGFFQRLYVQMISASVVER